MFGNQNKPTNYEKATSIIGEDAVLESSVFKSSGTVRIDGSYIGKLEINGDLIVDSKGVIEGTIDAYHALIAGRVTGDIKCSEEIHLASTANVKGNLYCSNLIIDDGALFNGNSTMTPSSNSELVRTTPIQAAQKKKTSEKEVS